MKHWGLLPNIVYSNDDPGVTDLDLFHSKVNFGNLGFSMGKSENSGFFRNELMKECENLRSRSFLDLGPMPFIYEI